MSNATKFPTKNESRSKKTVKRTVGDRTEEVAILGGATFTAVFESVATALKGISAPKRPNRCRPIHQEDAGDEAGTEAEWADIARQAPSSDRIRDIAKHLRETGQDAT